MVQVVISNTTAIFYLHRLGRLDLLNKLYRNIIVPQAVEDELAQGRESGEDVPEVGSLDWIEIKSVRIPRIIKLITDLGPGEAEVLALALDEPDPMVILDDLVARRTAKLQGFRITGTAGILLKAKQHGHIKAVKPLIKQLRDLGFRLSNRLENDILRLAKEAG